jgi:hypothetical protein
MKRSTAALFQVLIVLWGIGFVVGGMIVILLGNSDEKPPGIFMGLLAIFGSTVMAAVAAKFERILRNGLHTQSG